MRQWKFFIHLFICLFHSAVFLYVLMIKLSEANVVYSYFKQYTENAEKFAMYRAWVDLLKHGAPGEVAISSLLVVGLGAISAACFFILVRWGEK